MRLQAFDRPLYTRSYAHSGNLYGINDTCASFFRSSLLVTLSGAFRHRGSSQPLSFEISWV
jgi:hypothetical protein